ncbi:hypothetical protein, partial [Burkholderia pyrrocinia]|uniref:hypothetical protein n=1 Tax=Burkholderia pyrrocinia TaxID=60550 RepID=UPI001A9E18D2
RGFLHWRDGNAGAVGQWIACSVIASTAILLTTVGLGHFGSLERDTVSYFASLSHLAMVT